MTGAPARFPGRAPIEAYGNGGFRFAGTSHRGSILCLPSGIYAWEPATPLDEASLARPLAERGKIGLLILGTGRQLMRLPKPAWPWRPWTPVPRAGPTIYCWPRGGRRARR